MLFKKAEKTGKGNLILIGGNEDKVREKKILKRVLTFSKKRNIALIPTASYYPDEIERKYKDAFRDLNISSLELIDIRDKRDSYDDRYLKWVEKSDLIFFSGGDQVKLVEAMKGTPMLDLIKKMFYEGVTIVGTSAGAAAVSNPMIFDGDDRGFNKDAVNHGEGFGFIKNITIDTHFSERGRISRLTQFVISGFGSHLGIGLDEDTGIIVYPDYKIEVIGNRMVTLINSRRVTFSNLDNIERDELLTVDGLKVSFLSEGAIFDLKKWKLHSFEKKDKKEGYDNYYREEKKIIKEECYERF